MHGACFGAGAGAPRLQRGLPQASRASAPSGAPSDATGKRELARPSQGTATDAARIHPEPGHAIEARYRLTVGVTMKTAVSINRRDVKQKVNEEALCAYCFFFLSTVVGGQSCGLSVDNVKIRGSGLNRHRVTPGERVVVPRSAGSPWFTLMPPESIYGIYQLNLGFF